MDRDPRAKTSRPEMMIENIFYAWARDPISLIGDLRLQRVCEEAGDKTRTCDRLITNQLLYQLSYTSIVRMANRLFGRQPYSIGQI